MSGWDGSGLPGGWAVASLGELADEPVEQLGPRRREKFVYVDISSVDNQTKRIAERKELGVSAAPSRAKQNLRKDDVLVSMTRPNLNAVALVGQEFDGAVGSTGFHVLRSAAIEPSWLFHAVQTRQFVSSMCAVVQGALYPAIRPKDIESWICRVPPRAEQERITDALDELLSDLDAGVAALERVRTKLKHYRSAVLKAAVEGSLTAEWRRQHPSTEHASELLKRTLAERRRRWEETQLKKFKDAGRSPPKDWKAKYVEPIGPDTSNISGLPTSWCWTNVGQLAEVGTGATPDRGKREKFYASGTIPWVTSGCVNASRVREPSECVTAEALGECNLTLYPAGTLLLAMYGEGKTRGMCSELDIESTTNQALAAIQVSVSVRGYLKTFLQKNYEDTRRAATGGVQPNLNLGMVRGIALPLPPIAEQAVIVEAVEAQLSVIEHLECDLEKKLKSSQALRQSILRHAFAGQLVPQDPNDEPASELLKRIAAEREERSRLAKAARQAQPKAKTPRRRAAQK